MVRAVEASEGLALLGSGRIGDLGFRVPEVVHLDRPDRAPRSAEGMYLETEAASEDGRRSLTLVQGEHRLRLEFTIPTPEVTGTPSAAEAIGPDAWLVHAPLSAEDGARVRAARPGLVVLGNGRTLLGEGAPFIHALRSVRLAAGAGALLWAPRIALPHRVALLAYLGVDLLDETEGAMRAAGGEFLDGTLGALDPDAAQNEPLCPCAACAGGESRDLEGHAAWALGRELERARAAVRAGRLRELVEARLSAEPLLAEVLRYADRELGDVLEVRTPVIGTGVRGYVLRESQRRPEVVRFRRRFLERYQPPPSKRVLLLVPCSRTKPYRSSRSHRRFLGALEGVSPLERVHIVSVTSPLGLVPRELEDTYPARHYDIPVTGEWDEAERAAVLDALQALLRAGQYSRTVVHLDPVEYDFLRTTAGDASWTLADDRTTTNEALGRLRQAVGEALDGVPGAEGGPLAVVREELAAIAAVQFGREAAARLFAAPLRLAGRPWFQRITDGHGTDLATWREPRGLFHLTVAGGARLLPAHPLEVEVDPKVNLLGDLFAPGVARADPAIRTGDAVLLVRNGALVAVGEAALPGPLMTELTRGVAVYVRHRVHPTGGAAEGPTPT